MTGFWIAAGAMLVLAVAFVIVPLLRTSGGADGRRRAIEQAQRSGVLTEDEARAKLDALTAESGTPARLPTPAMATLGAVLAISAIALYRYVGEPRALDPVWQSAVTAVANANTASPDGETRSAPDLDAAVSGLAERLREDPDDLEGWMLLGRAYKTLQRFEPAREALSNALRLAPDDPDVLVEYAEAEVLASDSRRFAGAPREKLERALAAQPQHPRGLWLLGIADYQESRFAEAAQTWERLLALIPPEADTRASLLERIADARAQAGLPPDPSAPPAVTAAPAAGNPAAGAAATDADAPRLTVSVDLAPELKARVGASDVLFVFARAAEGPRMPLAIQRLPAASLPVTVTLDDSTSMMPAMKLSTIPQVVVGARISRSGQAAPQSGDLEVLSAPLANSHRDTIRLVIDTVVP